MSDALEYIEAYFAGTPSATEKEAFANRCASDPAFAEDVAFYISLRKGVQQELYIQKQDLFAAEYERLAAAKPTTGLLVRMRPFIAVAAACLLLFVVYTVFLDKPSSRALATDYIETNFTTIGITMGNAGTDSLQMGIAAYNAKKFSEAEKNFQSLQNGPQQAEALKYLGILYLSAGNYNQALAAFDTLSRNDQLYVNPGLFYKALTLMKRSDSGDREAARALLEEVVQKNLPGATEAKVWLEKW